MYMVQMCVFVIHRYLILTNKNKIKLLYFHYRIFYFQCNFINRIFTFNINSLFTFSYIPWDCFSIFFIVIEVSVQNIYNSWKKWKVKIYFPYDGWKDMLPTLEKVFYIFLKNIQLKHVFLVKINISYILFCYYWLHNVTSLMYFI